MTDGCPLCGGAQHDAYYRDARRSYRQCPRCQLVYVPPAEYLTREEERAVYEQHENAVDDPAYRRFLSRLCQPLSERLAPASEGLDFGCGPAPALAHMLEECGHRVALHDSFFLPETDVLERDYDFICASEVVEHLHHPAAELQRLWRCLRPGGWLGVMTKLVRDREAFANWHYIRDPTHVCFFSRESWLWWAAARGAEVSFVGSDVILLQKPEGGA